MQRIMKNQLKAVNDFTQFFFDVQDVAQGQFVTRVGLVWILTFISPSLFFYQE